MPTDVRIDPHPADRRLSHWIAYGQLTRVLTWILKGRKLVASRSLDDDWGLLMAEVG
jgi:hypothetical protein